MKWSGIDNLGLNEIDRWIEIERQGERESYTDIDSLSNVLNYIKSNAEVDIFIIRNIKQFNKQM